MKLCFVTRHNTHWGGDLIALHDLIQGCNFLGHEAFATPSLLDATFCDIAFLTQAGTDQRAAYSYLSSFHQRIGFIPFFEDIRQYYGMAYGFYFYVHASFLQLEDQGIPFHIETLFETPEVIRYYEKPLRKENLYNAQLLKHFELVIANSRTEAKVIQKECKNVNIKVIPWSTGLTEQDTDTDESILHLTGLKKGEYLLQIGRFETRKNQLATILATKDLDIPLVFIASQTYQPTYQALCLEAIKKWRKAPTFVIGQGLNQEKEKQLQVVCLEQLLPPSSVRGALAFAGLHVHPSFQELPGFTYLEAAKLGTASIVSEWTTLKDYFLNERGFYTFDERFDFILPYDIQSIKDKIPLLFGKKFNSPNHPIFLRTKYDVAQDFLNHL